jgi:hypothetical protein
VTITCTDAMAGGASLKVAGKKPRDLQMRGRTLASRSVRCAQPDTESVTLKPSKRVRRALRQVDRSVRVRLDVRLRAAGEPTIKEARRLSLRAR